MLGEFTIGFDRQEVEVLETAGKIKVCIHGPETTSGTITMMVNIPNSFNTGKVMFIVFSTTIT